MSRERALILYCMLGGFVGWVWLISSGPGGVSPGLLTLFLVLALLIESAGFRVPYSDPHSLVGIVILTAALVLGASNGALVAALSGLIFGVLLPLVSGRSRTFYLLIARPFLRSGIRASAILFSNTMAYAVSGAVPSTSTLFFTLIICYPLIIQLSRVIREYLQGGRTGLITWWRSSWQPALIAEVAPLPVAWLALAIYHELDLSYFLLSCAVLFASSLTVRHAALNLQRQRRSVRELSLLNQVSRAIISADMDVTALCDLVYRETSKVVDTSSFHLGLFEPSGDEYTLVVRVQDRVRQPPLVVQLPAGDGIIGWMRATGRGLLVHDFAEEMSQLPARPRYQSSLPPRSGIYVPLSVGETVIGTISIQSYRPRAFDLNDMQMLSLIADQSAVAIAKARAFAQANQRAVQLQAIHEVSERITAILDLEELLPSVVRLISERFGYDPVHIFTLEEGRLVFRASTMEGDALNHMRSLTLQSGDGIVRSVAERGQPILINDVTAETYRINDNVNTHAELAVPLRFGDENLGVLDVQSTEVGKFTDSDLFVMQTLAGQIAVAIESARAFTAQGEEAWTLNALLQVAENLARATTLDELLPVIVRLPPLLLGCDRCYCFIWDGRRSVYVPRAAYGLSREQRSHFLSLPIDEQQAPLLANARRTMSLIAINDATSQREIFPQVLEAFGGGALLVLPLAARGALLGMLVADYDKRAAPFTLRTLTLYNGIANQVAGALESALLTQEAAEAARLEEELRVARDIQTTLLPATKPVIAGWQIEAAWRSARLVGGDFYDFWRLPRVMHDGESRWSNTFSTQPLGFVIADVSDKGVPAAMFMALARSLVRAAALDGTPPGLALTRANRWIVRDSESGMFVTLFYGILEVESGMLLYTSAGHNPPLLVRAAHDDIIELVTPGIALGVLEEAHLGEAEVILEEGDVLVCYTDGVTEAINSAEEAFDVSRLKEVVLAHRTRSAAEILEAILSAMLSFTGALPPFDDVTLVIIKHDRPTVPTER